MKLIAEYILNEGAISIAELNAVDTDLWRKGVMSFGFRRCLMKCKHYQNLY